MSSSMMPLKGSAGQTFFKSQFCTKAQAVPSTTSFENQTIVVTGSNCGIGLASCEAMLGHKLTHLIMAVRSIDKGETAASRLRKAYPNAQIDVWKLDMASYASISSFVQRCKTELGHLDGAILNAGITQSEFKVCDAAGGHEEIFQVNYLSTALLALLLLPLLQASTREQKHPGRLTIVSSGLGLFSEFPNRDASPLIPTFDDATGWNVSKASERYNVTKTLVLMFVERLGQIVSPNAVIINAVDPGFTAGSALHQDLPITLRATLGIMKTIAARPLKDGASTYLDALAVKGKETHGSFVADWKVYPWHSMMYTAEGKITTGRLWDETLKELSFADVETIFDSVRSE